MAVKGESSTVDPTKVRVLGKGETGLGLVLSEGFLMPCIWNEEVMISLQPRQAVIGSFLGMLAWN